MSFPTSSMVLPPYAESVTHNMAESLMLIHGRMSQQIVGQPFSDDKVDECQYLDD